MSVKQRIKDFIKYKNISVRSFESACGLSYSYVNSIRVSIQPDKINSIAIAYPDLNTGWLLTGEGDMIKGSVVSAPVPEYVSNYKDKYLDALEQLNTVRVELSEAKEEINRLTHILNSAKEDTPNVPGSVRGAKAG